MSQPVAAPRVGETFPLPLSRLILDRNNPRAARDKQADPVMVGSIRSRGLLHNLGVAPSSTSHGKYVVKYGNRRLLALRALTKEGHFGKDAAFSCRLVADKEEDANGPDALEAQIAENIVRAAMSPIDEYEAFAKLVSLGLSVEDVAHRFVYYGATVKETGESDRGPSGDETFEKTIRFLKSYPVFNIEQIDDLPAHFYAFGTPATDRTPPPSAREDFFARIGANVRHGGDRAFYHRTGDFIQMPPFAAFDDPEKYYAVLGHETVHWTGAGHRLDRAKGKSFGDRQYAYEELVAEAGAAILGAAIDLRPDHIEDHAAYIGSWLKALKGDKRFIFRAAADAQRAVDFILERGGYAQGPAIAAETPLADAA